MDITKALLEQRGSEYGDFETLANNLAISWSRIDSKSFAPPQALAIKMIYLKLERILNSGKIHKDTIEDIKGYAELLNRTLKS